MSTVKKYLKLKSDVETGEKIADKAEGALEQVMKRFKVEFNCSTLKEAIEKSKRIRKQERMAERKFEEAMEEFEKDWSDELSRN